MAWKDFKSQNVDKVDRLVSEFVVWMPKILPCEKMKIRVYEHKNHTFLGVTDLEIIRIFDGYPEGAVGFGTNIEEALSETVRNFNEMVESDYPKKQYPLGVPKKEIRYSEYSDF